MKTITLTLTLALLASLGPLACNRKTEAQVQAEAAAAAADQKVAELQKRLDEARGAKVAENSDAQTREHLSKGQIKALERQVADAKQRAAAKKKEVEEVAKAPAAAPKAVVVEVPAGTVLDVKLAETLGTDKAQAGDAFSASLATDVVVEGRTVWPAGSPVRGVVAQSVPAGRLASGEGVLAIKITEVAGEGVEAGSYAVHGTAKGERNAKFIGGGALIGALAGVLSDRRNQGDHALGGAAIGAAVGTAAAAASADTVIRIPAEKAIPFKLAAPERITLRN